MRRKSRILDADGRNLIVEERRVHSLDASYDIIERRHDSDTWKYASPASANAVDTVSRRQQLRDMAYYEFRNNPHMRGIVQKVTHEVVGTGPRLEIEPYTAGRDEASEEAEKAAERLEELWAEHAEQIDLVGKLNLCSTERMVAGEAFCVFHPNPRNEVPIDFTVYEAAQFTTPFYDQAYLKNGFDNENGPVDGITFDRWNNPVNYHRLRHHPHGAGLFQMSGQDVESVDASVVAHLFRKERPSQFRGIPEVAPMLEIYSKLRRFVESKVTQEELRAKILGVLETGFGPDECADLGGRPIDVLINGGQFVNMPEGWKANMFQFDVTGVGVSEFMRSILAWATSALLVPWNLAAGDSSDYNFASGRLDFTVFNRVIDFIRNLTERTLLNRYVTLWLSFAKLAHRYPSKLGNFDKTWRWDPRAAIDQSKQANADVTYKDAGLLDPCEFAQRQIKGNYKDLINSKLKFEKYEADRRLAMGLPDPMAPIEDPEQPGAESGKKKQTA